ncbi:S9 family peptidase [Sphingomonas bacterium]|uniref:S9 family peptidase n=1 Tax=Sphingomonas bacterium TaxID=1895847 RepID=UPI001576B8BC|nr:S9 family peptidase [Sphingomonas bacterium]
MQASDVRRALAAAALTTLAVPAFAQQAMSGADTGGPISPEDIMRLHDMREVQMSPDGKTVLFTVTAQMATFGSPESTIWQVSADGRTPARVFVAGKGVDDHPRWSPDGRSVAFLSRRDAPTPSEAAPASAKPSPAADTGTRPSAPADATPVARTGSDAPGRQLWLVARDGRSPTRLTKLAGDVADFAWSPDGRRLAYLAADPDTPSERADRLARRDAVVVDAPGHVTRLWMLDVASRATRVASPAGIDVGALAWSPDGSRLAVKIADTASINDLFYHSRVALLDPTRGTLGPALIDHVAEEPRWSPDGRALLAEVIRTPGFIGLGLRIHDLASGATRAVADDHPGLLSHARWSADGRSIEALSFERTRSRLVQVNASDGAVTRVADLDGEADDLSTSRDGRRVAVALSGPDRPADVWTVDDGHPRAITRINPVVASWRLGRVREIAWTSSRDGMPVYGVLVTPPGYRDGTPLPTIVQGHGGPEWAWWSGWLGSWHEWAQMLATHGYAVLLPNPRGSDGQGTGFARAVGSDWGGDDYRDVLDGVDRLVAQKIADPARLGIGGWSYGGFLAAWAVTHPDPVKGDRFRAAVVGAGPSDMAAMARITDTPDFPLGYFGEPQAHLGDLDRVSSARLLDRVTTPVLVLHGADDTRVPATLGLEFFRGLRLLGKPATMVRYPREPHWFHEPEHQRDVQQRVLDWFDAALRSDARPSPARSPG